MQQRQQVSLRRITIADELAVIIQQQNRFAAIAAGDRIIQLEIAALDLRHQIAAP
ncbi:hypothetical protein D3C81_2227320 [compost metagenome]